MKLLLVEDDAVIADFIYKGFHQQGYITDIAGDAEQALLLMAEQTYDAIIADLMLPGMDGLEMIRQLRGQGFNTPVLILSARHTVTDRVSGLETGADDYLVKPFSFIELQARIQALLRRNPALQDISELNLADLRMDCLNRQVYRAGQKIILQPRELALLEYLLRNKNKVVSRTMIMEQIWDYHFDPGTNVVDVLVCRLRSKIDKNFVPPLLHTLRGVGYVLRINED